MTTTNTLAFDADAFERIARRFLSRFDSDAVDALADYLACGNVLDDSAADLLEGADLANFSDDYDTKPVLTGKGEDVAHALAYIR